MFFTKISHKTDEELMILVCKGEERAFTEIYKRYSTLLLRYFFRMLWKDHKKAEDFLHDLFVKLIERPEVFDSSKKFSTWVYSVANNMCKNEYRKQSFRAAAHGIISENGFADNGAEKKIDLEVFNDVIERALLGLSEEDRHLFTLRNELELSFSEIAGIIDCPEGTVKSRWFYLKKNLASQLREFQTLIK